MSMQTEPVFGKVIVVDPIPFRGGSKVATEVLLDELAKRMPGLTCHVLTQDPDSWSRCQHHPLWLPHILKGRESGIGYLLKQGWQTLLILWLVLRLGEVKCLVAASGPGVDLCCYWAARWLRCRVVQLIHGPVG
ncbi:MAG: glycosyltransferase family 4 protein, partial [Aeromonas veronii]